MIIDLHNHTYFSYDGCDSPEMMLENAIHSGIAVVGICDHQFTEGFDVEKYVNTLRVFKDNYKNRCDLKIGLEIGTRPKPDDLLARIVSKKLDYCLFESLDSERGMDLYEFLSWRKLFSCPVGLAHTDIFALGKRYGVDMLRILKEENIFWEINTSGNYTYYYDFITSRSKQEAVKKSAVTLSVGSDTHRCGDLNISKLDSANKLVKELGNPVVFER